MTGTITLEPFDPASATDSDFRSLHGFETGIWEGPCPDADLAAFADLRQVMNTQPLGRLDVEHQRVTPEQLRHTEAALAARGATRWTMFVRERATGRFAGFTEAFWKPSAPELLLQGDTGVVPEHRGRGFARWLKAGLLDRVLGARPEVRFVRTGNADSNATMLRINRELGFAPYTSRTIWQATLENLERHIASREPAAAEPPRGEAANSPPSGPLR